ncbi:MAG TPA: hypothetical protein VKE96_31315 [Vicinamibacterales bacterium]|nr:hypothetical protein [Vicinamibacterales bacterium]
MDQIIEAHHAGMAALPRPDDAIADSEAQFATVHETMRRYNEDTLDGLAKLAASSGAQGTQRGIRICRSRPRLERMEHDGVRGGEG